MTLHEAVIEAARKNFQWVAIDFDKEIYFYTSEPRLSEYTIRYKNRSQDRCLYIGDCTTPLGGTVKDWVVNIEELTL